MSTYTNAQRVSRNRNLTGLSTEIRNRLDGVTDANSVSAVQKGCDMLRGLDQQLEYPSRKIARTVTELDAVYNELIFLTTAVEAAMYKLNNRHTG